MQAQGGGLVAGPKQRRGEQREGPARNGQPHGVPAAQAQEIVLRGQRRHAAGGQLVLFEYHKLAPLHIGHGHAEAGGACQQVQVIGRRVGGPPKCSTAASLQKSTVAMSLISTSK